MPGEQNEVEHLKQSDDTFDRFIATLTEHDIHQTAATALTLQFFGGNEKTRNGRHIRKEIHTGLIVGSQVNVPNLVDHLTQLIPNSAKINASNSTYTGLTGPVRSLGPNKGWCLENGVLTDNTNDYLAIQNPSALDDKTIDCLKEAAGSGTITISKKGYHETVPINSSLLFIGTPTWGDWDEYTPIREQIPLNTPLSSLLDIVYTDLEGREERTDAPPIDTSVARDYIKQARSLSPQIPVHVDNELFEAVVEIHIDNLDKNSVPQQAEDTIRRLAEASAKARHADKVTTEDAQRAIATYRRPYEDIYGIDYEAPDINWGAVPGIGPNKEERRKRRAIKQIFANKHTPISEDDLLEAAHDRGFSRRETLLLLGELKGEGELTININGDWYAPGSS